MSKKKAPVSAEDFVEVWLRSTSYQEVVEATGLTYSNVVTRACNLRKRGVQLPKFVHAKTLDYAGLNALITDKKRAKR